jgi:signal transduction histidine kinase
MLGRRAREAAYAAVGLLVGVPASLLVLLLSLLGAALSITVVGLPLVVVSGELARLVSRAHRSLAHRLLQAAPESAWPRSDGAGMLGRLRAGLTDPGAWRARAYLLLRLPLAVLAGASAIYGYGYAATALTYPAWRLILPAHRDPAGSMRRGLELTSSVVLDSPMAVLVVALAGALLSVLVPWWVAALLAGDQALARWVLTPGVRDEELAAQRRRRAHALDDAAATLRRVERDLHDGPQARLVASAMTLGLAREHTAHGSDPGVSQLVGRAHDEVKTALGELRDLARGFHPAALDQGLAVALEGLTDRCAYPVALSVALERRPSPAIETIVYFTVAELVTNAAKHANPEQITVNVTGGATAVTVQVHDDGHGGAWIGGAGGLHGLSRRVDDVAGTLTLDSPPAGPTTVEIVVPYRV